MSQIDTFDPKRLGDPVKNIAGSAYPSIKTNVPGVEVTEHLKNCAPLMDLITAVRTVNHEETMEHATAVLRVHTGRPTAGTIQYPSIGSIVSSELGAVDAMVPAYVVVGYPNIARDPGFLGPNAGYLYVTDTKSGPNGLTRPDFISNKVQKKRESVLNRLRSNSDTPSHLESYDHMLTQGIKLAGPDFMGSFDLTKETASRRDSYGGEFGQRCLLARRLVERGVKFIEVSHNLNFKNGTGWDVHFDGLKNQHILIDEVDQALAALIKDLYRLGKLDETIIAIGTEFGRPGHFDSGGGRGHLGTCFSLVLAGGGLRHRGAYGQTDDFSENILENPVTIADFHATILASMGIDFKKDLYAGDRPVPITDGGRPIQKLFG